MEYMNLEDFELCLKCVTEGAHKYSVDVIRIFYSCAGNPGKFCYRLARIRNKGKEQY